MIATQVSELDLDSSEGQLTQTIRLMSFWCSDRAKVRIK
jgi:hypothetical protein